ncbi:MAG TPA: TMEM175 family protein [Pyrinomonadaceae bacterium]|nr:TMEM175 family protein [Pyrinomonadaceae bacterium]
MTKEQTDSKRIEGTGRLEAFSDGVFAIIVTLLIFEVRVPALTDLSNSGVLNALVSIAPKGVSFAMSFFTVAIFWVTHHHVFSRITHSNWKLMWFNNALLFWLAIVPFTTAFIGNYPTQSVVVALYATILTLAALTFWLMNYYVFFKSDLLSDRVSTSERWRHLKRGRWVFILYGLAVLTSFLWVYAALVILGLIPFIFLVPRLLKETE